MSFLVVVLVALLVFFYVRGTRQARQQWLRKLDLPGVWYLQSDDARSQQVLKLSGELDGGQYELQQEAEGVRGHWQLEGHTLTFSNSANATSEAYELHLFKPGSIGLEDPSGVRRIFSKQASNVVPLHQGAKRR